MGITPYIAVIINGICVGGLYGLMSSAWSFQVGALKYPNFAYGACIMISMYFMFYMIREWGLNSFIMVPLVLAINFFIGFFMKKTILRGTDRNRMILCTMGFQLILINLATFFFTATPRDMALLEKRIYLTEQISVGSIQLICFVMSFSFLFLFQFLLKKTWTGRAIRAVVQNREVAMLMGIKSENILDLAYSISYMLVGVAAMMLMLMNQLDPAYGTKIQGTAFMVCVMAGIGNISGVFFTGILVGVLSALISMVLGTIYLNPVIYLIFVILLLVKPYGLFTKESDVARTL